MKAMAMAIPDLTLFLFIQVIDHLDQLHNDANAALVSDTPFVTETLLDAEKAVAYVKRILGDGGGNADVGADGTSGAGLLLQVWVWI